MRFEEFSDRELRAERARRVSLLDSKPNGSTAEVERAVRRITGELDRRAALRRSTMLAALKVEYDRVMNGAAPSEEPSPEPAPAAAGSGDAIPAPVIERSTIVATATKTRKSLTMNKGQAVPEGASAVQAKGSVQIHVLAEGSKTTLCGINAANWKERVELEDGTKFNCPLCAEAIKAEAKKAKEAAKAEAAQGDAEEQAAAEAVEEKVEEQA